MPELDDQAQTRLAIAALFAALVKALERRDATESDFKSSFKDALDEVTREIRDYPKHGVTLRQSYARVGKRALMAYQRYAHAKQFKRANRALRSVRTFLGRVFRDIVRAFPMNPLRKSLKMRSACTSARQKRWAASAS